MRGAWQWNLSYLEEVTAQVNLSRLPSTIERMMFRNNIVRCKWELARALHFH
jgi:hypothetical protein